MWLGGLWGLVWDDFSFNLGGKLHFDDSKGTPEKVVDSKQLRDVKKGGVPPWVVGGGPNAPAPKTSVIYIYM